MDGPGAGAVGEGKGKLELEVSKESAAGSADASQSLCTWKLTAKRHLEVRWLRRTHTRTLNREHECRIAELRRTSMTPPRCVPVVVVRDGQRRARILSFISLFYPVVPRSRTGKDCGNSNAGPDACGFHRRWRGRPKSFDPSELGASLESLSFGEWRCDVEAAGIPCVVC